MKWKFNSSNLPRTIFAVSAVLLLIGILTYLQLAFQGADVKTAIRLVEEAKTDSGVLRERLEKVIPMERRHCRVAVESQFHGHVRVECRDTAQADHVLSWKVNIIDGMVIPANPSAEILGKGGDPWPIK